MVKVLTWLASGYSLQITKNGREVAIFPIWHNSLSVVALVLGTLHVINHHWL